MKKLLLLACALMGFSQLQAGQIQVSDVFEKGEAVYDAAPTGSGKATGLTVVTSSVTNATYTLSYFGTVGVYGLTNVYATTSSATTTAPILPAMGWLVVPYKNYIEIQAPENCSKIDFNGYRVSSGNDLNLTVTCEETTVASIAMNQDKANSYSIENVEGGKRYKLFFDTSLGNKTWRLHSVTYTIEEADNAPMPDPTFAPSAGKVKPGTAISLSCPGYENAEIRYALNGEDPTAESTLYTTPIIITDPVTIKAIALGVDGKENSQVATAAYEVYVVKDFNLVTAESQINTQNTFILVGKSDEYPVRSFAMNTPSQDGASITGLIIPEDQIVDNSILNIAENEAQYLTLTTGETGKATFPWLIGDGAGKYLASTGTAADYFGLAWQEKNKLCYAKISFGTENQALIEFNNNDLAEDCIIGFSHLSNTNTYFNLYPVTAGQMRYVWLYQSGLPASGETGIENLTEDVNAAAEYYDLQGRRVMTPEQGLFIKKLGNRATKVIK